MNNNINEKLHMYAFLLALAAILLLFLYGIQGTDLGKQRAIAGIPEPIQTPASGGETIALDGYQIQIDYQYAYDISALVISTQKYAGFDVGDKLAPKDVALAWGAVAEYNKQIDFHWGQTGRWYFWKVSSYQELEPVGGPQGVTLHSSNNHLIPSDKTVKAKIRKIKTGDYIRLTGYLVNIDASKPDGSRFWWNTSTTREDDGSGSCEVFYVTNVEWLD